MTVFFHRATHTVLICTHPNEAFVNIDLKSSDFDHKSISGCLFHGKCELIAYKKDSRLSVDIPSGNGFIVNGSDRFVLSFQQHSYCFDPYKPKANMFVLFLNAKPSFLQKHNLVKSLSFGFFEYETTTSVTSVTSMSDRFFI